MDWQNERVIILGAARQGTALARYLGRQGAHVVITDNRTKEQLAVVMTKLSDVPNLLWSLGGHPLELLDDATLVCPSGGVPLTIPFLKSAREREIPFSNDSQIFLEAAPCPVIGITGSAGKTTTTTLVGRMLEAASVDGHFRKVWMGGNIGFPLINELSNMSADDVAVIELSSFQLDLMTASPDVAVLLNIVPNHLDRHVTMDAYTAAKRNNYQHQNAENTAVFGLDDDASWAEREFASGRIMAFSQQALPDNVDGCYLENNQLVLRVDTEPQVIMPASDINLRGRHNILNVLAACAAVAALGVESSEMRAGALGFGGVPHRLEFVRNINGVVWYNDSKATGPALAVAAIRAFEEPLIVLAGGKDKNLPWDDFANTVNERVDHLILFGEATGVIEMALKNDASKYTVDVCSGLQAAVSLAADLAENGDVVLLAPGGTSFDEFKDFEERGDMFKRWVMDLSENEGSVE